MVSALDITHQNTMADHESYVSSIIDDERPIALRKKRRNSATRPRNNSQTKISQAVLYHGIATPPATPKRAKKRVRFSDPGPIIDNEPASSGLTPFIQRTTLSSTPTSRRRQSTPASQWNRAQYDDTPIAGTLQFAPLRQVLDGRVKRRLRRNRLSEEVITIESDKRREARERKSEVERLRAELAAKDLEVRNMQEEQEIASQIEGESGITPEITTSLKVKIQNLEHEIRHLKVELQRKEPDTGEDGNWTLAARDPFDFEDDEQMTTNYDHDFTMNDEMITTPTRLNTSFPSPPSTMPNTPNTPCRSRNVSSESIGVQISLPVPDPENARLRTQLQDLQSDMKKLNSTIALNSDHTTRLTSKLSDFIPTFDSEEYDHTTLDSALDTVLTQLALSQSYSLEKETAFSALSNEISSLGFNASSPDEALEIIASQFRQARLDLEYLTPGEVIEGFENDKLLTMLISRIKVLVEKSKQNDDDIDQYHEQEVLLRQQLDTRVSSMDEMRRQLQLTENVVGSLQAEVHELGTGNERLKKALEGYRTEVKALEGLIGRVEREGRETELSLRSEAAIMQGKLRDEVLMHDVTKADIERKETIIAELERRLAAAFQSGAEIQDQLAALNAVEQSSAENAATISHLKSSAVDRERAHGEALALRDARVSELREEVQRVNYSLKTAHSTIISLRKHNQELEIQIESEKKSSQFIAQNLFDQFIRGSETAKGFINGDVSVEEPSRTVAEDGGLPAPAAAVRKGGLFDGKAVRRASKKRRRYDSGLGFLEEEDESELLSSDI